MGPAATEASAPNLNLLESNFSMPSLFMINITKSTASPPICTPQLPPTTLKGAGALHPVAVRQVAKPLPYSAPNTNPPFLGDRTTPRQRAGSIRSCGIPLSGAAIISSRTSAEALTRFTSSSPVIRPCQVYEPQQDSATKCDS